MSLMLTALTGGCAQNEGIIDLVQPGYIKKADLLHKSWYYRRTVVDSAETAPWMSIGGGDLFKIERVVFDVQEKYLIAYRDYETISGADEREIVDPLSGELVATNPDFRGAPIAAFPIDSHFDVIAEYNPATGEKTNVLREDTVDRQWWERQYVRVDWGRVISTRATWDLFVLPVDIFGINGSEWVHPDDAANPHHARLTPERGYFDFVTNHFMAPSIRTCTLMFNRVQGSCEGGETRVRHAFSAVDTQEGRGYQPLYYPDSVTLKDSDGQEIRDPVTDEVLREKIFERFGFYRIDQLTYDDQRGLTQSGRLYNMIRFNIWQRSFDDEGQVLPYPMRTVRPIVYTLNWDFPTELQDTAFEVASEWNNAFKATVATLQGRSIDDVDDVFVLKPNRCSSENIRAYLATYPKIPWEERIVNSLRRSAPQYQRPTTAEIPTSELDHWCSALEYHSTLAWQEMKAHGQTPNFEPFAWEQIGDTRYNMMHYITQRTLAGWSGYGPMLGDPVTGRNVQSTAYVMGRSIDEAATRALEYVDFINGELSLPDLLQGANVPNIFFEGTFDPRAMTTDEALAVLRAGSHKPTQDYMMALEHRFQALGGDFRSLMSPMENGSFFAERASRVTQSALGKQLEQDYLIRQEDLMLAAKLDGSSWGPGQPVTDEVWNAATSVASADLYGLHQKDQSDPGDGKQQVAFAYRSYKELEQEERSHRFLQERTMCPVMDFDGNLLGLADRLKDLPHDEKWLILRREIFKAVMLHEVGHNIGLRHNFSGSYDALNYNETFWQLEQTLGSDIVAKQRASQPEFMYSSVMDYHGRVNADFQGLGLYDRAAVKFGYGQIIENFASESAPGGPTLRSFLFDNDYKDLLFNDTDGPVTHDAYFPSRQAMYERQDVVFDWTRTDLQASDIQAVTAREVPYMFCSDEFANVLPTCKRFDFGANQREVQQASEARYDNYFVFSNFRRNRLTFNFRSVARRALPTFMDTLLTYQYFYLYRSKNPDFLSTDLGEDMAQAVRDGLNLMSRVIATPSPNIYYRCVPNPSTGNDTMYYSLGRIDYDPSVDPSQGIGPLGEICDVDTQVSIGLDEGRPLFLGFTDDLYAELFTLNSATNYLGNYFDKENAIFTLAWPRAFFPRENQIEDIREYSVGFYRLYTEEINDLLRGLIRMDDSILGSGIDETSGTVLPKQMIEQLPTSAKIAPALAQNLQYLTLFYGLAFMTTPYDDSLDFGRRARVVVKGTPDDFYDDADPLVVECTLPEGGVTYRSRSVESSVSDFDIGQELIEQCTQEVQIRNAAQSALAQANIDVEAAQDDLAAAMTDQERETATEALREAQRVQREADREFTRTDVIMRRTEQVLIFTRTLNRVFENGAL
ncbi:MAG: zinc-dependent metalloprotease [Myxococcota bacterium]